MTENHYYINVVNSKVFGPKIFLLDASSVKAEIHLTFSIESSDGATVELFENTDASNGNAIIPINNNRNSKITTKLAIFEDPTISSDGDKILMRANKNPGRISISSSEQIILKSNGKYQLKITPLTNISILITTVLNWSEI